MKKKSLLTIFASVLCFAIAGFSIKISTNQNKNEKPTLVNNNPNNVVSPATEVTITIRDIADYLENKNEHYPMSDEFIERYQQTSGGYIDYAKKTGHMVNKEMHEPNQKWHFFNSWLYQSIDDGSLTWDADAKKRVYTNLLCPELLLWIYEATEVDPIKVRNAKKVAEEGKSAGTNVSTIAKNMRACVAWEDIQVTLLKYMSEQ